VHNSSSGSGIAETPAAQDENTLGHEWNFPVRRIIARNCWNVYYILIYIYIYLILRACTNDSIQMRVLFSRLSIKYAHV
jgi:hypothetical protein